MQRHLYVCDHCHKEFTTAFCSIDTPTSIVDVVDYRRQKKVELDLCDDCFNEFYAIVEAYKVPFNENPEEEPTDPPEENPEENPDDPGTPPDDEPPIDLEKPEETKPDNPTEEQPEESDQGKSSSQDISTV